MEASAGLVAGSHNRNELVVIHGHEEHKPMKNLSGQVCEICGDEVGLTVDGELFVACNECGFPVCRPCYEYERREGSQLCPQCKTRYNRLKGSPRVEGDDDEDNIDDIEHEFNIEEEKRNTNIAEAMLHGKMSYGRGREDEEASQYRMVIVTRLVVLAFFLRYRILNPVHDAFGLWLTSIICEIWFAFSWILDQFPKWFPIDRETYLDRLSRMWHG